MTEQGELMREMLAFVADWARRTDKAVHAELKRLNIGFKDELDPSIRSTVLELGAARLGIEMRFLDYGRLVDMGAGPGSVSAGSTPTVASIVTKVENANTNRQLLTGKKKKKKVRRPKKFYSRTVYARFNALLGIIDGALVEQAVSLVKSKEPGLNLSA
jgi:hypothetical protein